MNFIVATAVLGTGLDYAKRDIWPLMLWYDCIVNRLKHPIETK
jgi:hypothetical protein